MEKEGWEKLSSVGAALAACVPPSGACRCGKEWHMKSAVVGSQLREGTWCIMGYHGFQAVRLTWGTEPEGQLSSRVSFLRGFEQAPQFADLDTNLYKEV